MQRTCFDKCIWFPIYPVRDRKLNQTRSWSQPQSAGSTTWSTTKKSLVLFNRTNMAPNSDRCLMMFTMEVS